MKQINEILELLLFTPQNKEVLITKKKTFGKKDLLKLTLESKKEQKVTQTPAGPHPLH